MPTRLRKTSSTSAGILPAAYTAAMMINMPKIMDCNVIAVTTVSLLIIVVVDQSVTRCSISKAGSRGRHI